MKPNQICFNDIITEHDIKNGSLILLAGRPGIGKTKTCCELVKKYDKTFKSLYFDLSGHSAKYWIDGNDGLILQYYSSIDIIKEIENTIEKKEIKFVFIDYWQVVECKEEWFITMLLELAYSNKLVIVITTNLDRQVEKRKNHIPFLTDILRVCDFLHRTKKIIAITHNSIWNDSYENDLDYKYYSYRD
ncbi:MAG: DnaB-like helicase C-terminal domain-containing protein [Bacilli bacterium]|nr:DnaB-like helicase C-terminal domain-containing protein [Bacilli bacterium]